MARWILLVLCCLPFSLQAQNSLRRVRPVLRGVLTRGGGSGGMSPLDEQNLSALCRLGFKDTIYLYASPMAPKTVRCGSNQMSYESIPFTTGQGQILAKINAAIHDPSKGPIFVHCWNGLHAAGQISAIALRQFCGYTADQAVQYWKDNVSADERDSFAKVLTNIRKFKADPALELSAAEQARICPRPLPFHEHPIGD